MKPTHQILCDVPLQLRSLLMLFISKNGLNNYLPHPDTKFLSVIRFTFNQVGFNTLDHL